MKDLSDKMISYAKTNFSSDKYKNLDFVILDANKIKFKEDFDIIFASFSLHWIANFVAFMNQVNLALRKNGKIIFTIPLGMSNPLQQATTELLNSSKWSKFFKNYTEPYPGSQKEAYKNAILNSGFEFNIFEEINHKKIFDSRTDLENYIYQWYPFLNYLNSKHKQQFFDEVINKYLQIEPLRADGSVAFEFPRLDIIAMKI